ncbi:hypothetical protein BK799_31145 [Rhodococcus sp. D-1]|nr:hypothetical protein BK799_31145 [Rhodococcus sp. D-1]
MWPCIADGQLAECVGDGRAERECRGVDEVAGRARGVVGVRAMCGKNLAGMAAGSAAGAVDFCSWGMELGIS